MAAAAGGGRACRAWGGVRARSPARGDSRWRWRCGSGTSAWRAQPWPRRACTPARRSWQRPTLEREGALQAVGPRERGQWLTLAGSGSEKKVDGSDYHVG
jgi:hypothetical protein